MVVVVVVVTTAIKCTICGDRSIRLTDRWIVGMSHIYNILVSHAHMHTHTYTLGIISIRRYRDIDR